MECSAYPLDYRRPYSEGAGKITDLLIRKFLIWFALKLPINQVESRQEYPQLWYCMPHHPRFARRILQWLCGKITRHEISETERGYGGGKFIDCNCRWCDKQIKVPKIELDICPLLQDLMNELDNQQETK
jgi:hypothetical protein